MIDCVAGYHLNPWTCGIAKFNMILARHLGLPVVGIRDGALTRYRRPLLSIKLSEFSESDAADLDAWGRAHAGCFELFLHAFDGTPVEQRLLAAAARVSVANAELARTLRPARPDLQEMFCPGTILGPQRYQRTDLSVFTFGMAHKIRVPLYRRLRDLLEATGKSYSVYVSTALHENTSFDGSFVVRFEELQSIFDRHVYFMGYLSDTAVYNHLIDCTYIAAFFEKGLRANNTTVNAAMESGCAVITNLDGHSPAGLVHMRNVIDINCCDRLPDLDETRRIGLAARDIAHTRYGWDQLVAQLRSVVRL
ncbi:MAG: glycosyltransferase [Acidobacteria bacterium]|nr:glycosyltransferase [Acidobacteriota bacterium]